jgi:hypothetical protein
MIESTTSSSTTPRNRTNGIIRRGGSLAPVVLIVLFLVIGALAVLLVVWDGRSGETQINEDPPSGSVEGNLAQLANWAVEPIRGWIATNGAVPDAEKGTALLEELQKKGRPTFYPPTPASPEGNPTYRISNNGFEIVFPGRSGKPVVCSFSSAGAYEGATGMEGFTGENDSVNDPLEGVAP